ncbi:PIN domain-containing protein [Larkinella soli]|uniref:PIN domain-containing protein n=1 Tax=Larkinella soli TaxID=1770527 RepID=UPI001E3574D2|nr:PIN domain-containing protein [Larkinella soli]
MKDAVNKLGDQETKQAVLNHLNNIDYKIPELGESAALAVTRIEKLLKSSDIVETSDKIKLRAAQRAINKKAPFHGGKNSFNDAILIEIYADYVSNKKSAGVKFSFVTHNTSDFSLPNGNNKLPHPDIEFIFTKIKSSYYIKLTEAVQKIRPKLVSDLMLEHEWVEETRSLSDILEAMNELMDKIWYNRYQNWLYRIKIGELRIATKKDAGKYNPNVTSREVYNGARKAAKEKEKQFGKKNLGPWNNFEWGMLNGKLSALRWVLGDEWDFLDT